MMHVIILTQYYPPESGAPQNRLSHLAGILHKQGHTVTVLTALPNYPSNRIFPEYRNRLYAVEKIDNVRVVRTWLFVPKRKNFFPRLLNYFSFVVSSVIGGFFLVGKADFLMCESPPLFLGASAWLLSLIKTRGRYIFNVSDLWPASAVALGVIKKGAALALSEKLERFLYTRARAVSGQTEGIIRSVQNTVPAKKTLLFPNGVDTELFYPEHERRFDGETLCAGYGGVLGLAQGLFSVVQSASLLRQEPVFFHLYGDGPVKNDLEAAIRRDGLQEKVMLKGWVERKSMRSVINSWDIGLVPLAKDPLFFGARPSKMFECMACGTPVVGLMQGEGARIIEQSGSGVALPPEDAESLAAAIKDLIHDRSRLKRYSRSGVEFVRNSFDRRMIAEQYISEIVAVLSE